MWANLGPISTACQHKGANKHRKGGSGLGPPHALLATSLRSKIVARYLVWVRGSTQPYQQTLSRDRAGASVPLVGPPPGLPILSGFPRQLLSWVIYCG